MAQLHPTEENKWHHKDSINLEHQGRRRVGQHKARWKYNNKAELKRAGNIWRQTEGRAWDRTSWKKLINDLCPPGGWLVYLLTRG